MVFGAVLPFLTTIVGLKVIGEGTKAIRDSSKLVSGDTRTRSDPGRRKQQPPLSKPFRIGQSFTTKPINTNVSGILKGFNNKRSRGLI